MLKIVTMKQALNLLYSGVVKEFRCLANGQLSDLVYQYRHGKLQYRRYTETNWKDSHVLDLDATYTVDY